MRDWRSIVVDKFIPLAGGPTVAVDPDGLVTEEGVANRLRGRGFDTLEFGNAVEFRYTYETKYRSRWDRGLAVDFMPIVHLRDGQIFSLPYDLIEAGREIRISLAELMPKLNYPVLRQLDWWLLDKLYNVGDELPTEILGGNATKDFAFRHAYGIDMNAIVDEPTLLRTLLRLHYRETPLPEVLGDRLIHTLSGMGTFRSWPLERIVLDASSFFEFLQERWLVFVRGADAVELDLGGRGRTNLRYRGPRCIPFDHPDIRAYMDDLFSDGRLSPVAGAKPRPNAEAWIKCGIDYDTASGRDVQIERRIGSLRERCPRSDSRYLGWTAFAIALAELASKIHLNGYHLHSELLRELSDGANEQFAEWLKQHYASLANLPPTNAPMVHHIPRLLRRDISANNYQRVALLVVDGLALDQWVTVRGVLRDQDTRLHTKEAASFAWIPTITSVSRQSIFSGRPPYYFSKTIATTSSEEALWLRFWEELGFDQTNVVYRRGIGDGDPAQVISETIDSEKTRVVGFVVDKVDRIMHGMQLGAAGMHNQVRQWCEAGFLGGLIGQLLDRDFAVWLTSDHGNAECEGKGRLSAEGLMAEIRGARARVYPSSELCSRFARNTPYAQEWFPTGLPDGYFPLIATERGAFAPVGQAIVGHGGMALEEVIVPFAKLERRTS